MFMPFQVLALWLRGLLSAASLGLGIYFLAYWYNHREVAVQEPGPAADVRTSPDQARAEQARPPVRVRHWQFGLNWETAALLGGLILLGWSVGGSWVASPRLRRRRGTGEPQVEPPVEHRTLHLPDGTELWVQFHGLPDGDPVVLTHGWGLDQDEWCYAWRELGQRCRLISWDLPGLGRSSRPPDRDWSLERLARCLDAVVALGGGRPVTLVGHSIGGMILLTYCRLFPDALGTRVGALVLAHSTYTNPVHTTSRPGLYRALQKPVLEPLCHLMIWLAPVVRILNWLSYLNGSAHRSTERDSFSGHESRGQLDFMTRYYCKAAPDVLARGMLAMFRYDATDVLSRIGLPTLVVAGDQDRTCTPEASRFMADAIPGADLAVLASARHCGLFEHHATFHAVVAKFLAAASTGVRREASARPSTAWSRS